MKTFMNTPTVQCSVPVKNVVITARMTTVQNDSNAEDST